LPQTGFGPEMAKSIPAASSCCCTNRLLSF
jgi:hypothetical protein